MEKFDLVIVGAGFAGMYGLHKFREKGLRVKVFEAGSDVGGDLVLESLPWCTLRCPKHRLFV